MFVAQPRTDHQREKQIGIQQINTPSLYVNDFISHFEIIQQVYYAVTIYTWEED